MKQVLIYNQIGTAYHGAQRYIDSELAKYFQCQIDISLLLGWRPDDIILGTNFEFEYRGVVSHQLTDICQWSGFNNFWFGAVELLERGIITTDFWLHDHDSWPNRYFEFPVFDGDVAGCEYIGTDEWNCGSIYCKKDSLDTLHYIKDFLTVNQHVDLSSDEVFISYLRKNSNPIQHKLTSINTRYNVGVTHGPLRIKSAETPINVLSFNPGVPKGILRCKESRVFDQINTDVLGIYNKYFLGFVN